MLCHVPFWIKCDKKQCCSKTEHIRVENVLAFNNVAANLLTFVTHLLTSHVDKVLELFFIQYSFSRGRNRRLDVFLLLLILVLSEPHEILIRENLVTVMQT